MSTFERAIPLILQHEGGFVNNPSDPGGATNYGISLRFLADHPDDGDFNDDGQVNIEDIMNMTPDEATAIYKKYWWDKFLYGLINDQTIATKVFDFAVNMGAVRAHKLLQSALNETFSLSLTVDGVLGVATVHALNVVMDGSQEQQLLDGYSNEAWAFYQQLIANNPKLATFATGWKNRAFAIDTANSLD